MINSIHLLTFTLLPFDTIMAAFVQAKKTANHVQLHVVIRFISISVLFDLSVDLFHFL